jgi:hypothetical protein
LKSFKTIARVAWIATFFVAAMSTMSIPTLAQKPSASVGGNCTKIGSLSGTVATPLVCQKVGNRLKWVLTPGGNCSKAGALAGTVTKPWVCQKVSGKLKWVVINASTATITTTTAVAPATTTIVQQVCTSGGVCSVGNTGPGGGIVFYDAGTVQSWGRYLEAAPNDLGTYMWNDAVNAAQAYVSGGLTDWRLPTKDELSLLYNNRGVVGSFDISSDSFYWSSIEYSSNHAWGQSFYRGKQNFGGKNTSFSVRPVRAF